MTAKGDIMRSVFAVCLAAAGVITVSSAQAAELKVLAAEVVEPAVAVLAAQFEKNAGHKLKIEYGFGVQQNKRIQGGEAFDVLITPNGLIKNPATAALLAPGTTQLLRIGQGVAVKKGAPKPDISTPEAFKQALLKAQSIAFVPAGQSGKATLAVFDKLGIAEPMKAKTKPQKVENVVPAVAKGEAELALFLSNYLVGSEAIDYVGPYPGNLQSYIPFSAGVSAKASDSEAAKAFVQFLSAPAAAPVIKSKGMEPG
jgi:molybdate transport system substrate-binding protein